MINVYATCIGIGPISAQIQVLGDITANYGRRGFASLPLIFAVALILAMIDYSEFE